MTRFDVLVFCVNLGQWVGHIRPDQMCCIKTMLEAVGIFTRSRYSLHAVRSIMVDCQSNPLGWTKVRVLVVSKVTRTSVPAMSIDVARVLLGIQPFTARRDLPQPPSSVKLHWNRVFDMYVEPPSQQVPISNCVQYTPFSVPPSQLVDHWKTSAPFAASRTKLRRLRSRTPKRKAS